MYTIRLGQCGSRSLGLVITILLFSLMFIARIGYSAESIYTPWYSNVAIAGFDVVAYHTDARAVKGSKAHRFDWLGVEWRFASAEHQQMFIQAPGKYLPEYGGYCAYAMADGKRVSVDPTQFSIVAGKLYLNYSKKVQAKWLLQRDSYISQADQHWFTD